MTQHEPVNAVDRKKTNYKQGQILRTKKERLQNRSFFYSRIVDALLTSDVNSPVS